MVQTIQSQRPEQHLKVYGSNLLDRLERDYLAPGSDRLSVLHRRLLAARIAILHDYGLAPLPGLLTATGQYIDCTYTRRGRWYIDHPARHGLTSHWLADAHVARAGLRRQDIIKIAWAGLQALDDDLCIKVYHSRWNYWTGRWHDRKRGVVESTH